MWRDNKRPASFRGVSFWVNDATLTAGRRLARHEYPQRDIPYLEDMGRKAREYRVEAFVLGADYMLARDALLAAIEKPGAGQLVHPWHGTKVVTVQDCQLSESTGSGGYAKFSLTFIEAGQRNAPGVTADTRGLFERARDRVKASMEAIYAETMEFIAQPMSVIQDGLETLDELRALPGVLNSITSMSGWGVVINVLSASDALSGLLEPASLVRAVQALVTNLPDGDLAAVSEFARPPLSAVTAAAVTRNENRAQMELLVRQAAVIELVDRVLSVEYPSVSVAQEARGNIVSAVDQVLLHPSLDQRAVQDMLDLRTKALAHIKSLSPRLPVLISVESRCVRPVLVIAHEHYGPDWWKTGRDASTIAVNHVRHPGFVPVQPLQMEVVRAAG